MLVTGGDVNVSVYFQMRLTAGGDATGLTITDFDLSYTRNGVATAVKADVTDLGAADAGYSANAGYEVDPTDCPGLHRFDFPDAAFAAGVRDVLCTIKHASCFTETLRVEIDAEVSVITSLKDAGIILSRSTIETVTDQTNFIIPDTDDATDNNAYNGALAVIIDGTDPNQRAFSLISDYNAGTRTVTLAKAAEFTVTNSDTLIILSQATASSVWDELLTGATHNIASSAGRRLRGVQAFGDYANGALWFDSENGVGGQVSYENATVQNPSNSLTDIVAIAGNLKMVRIQVAPGSTLALGAIDLEGYSIVGENWTLTLDGQSVSGTFIHGADVSGIGTGASSPHFHCCHIGTTSMPPSHFTDCGLEDVLTLTGAGDYFLDNCHSAILLPAIDFEDAAENKNVYVSSYGGDIEIRNIGQAGSTDTLHLDGDGTIVLASTCEAATIEIQGNFTITDNVGGGGFVDGAGGTLNDDARIDVDQINAECDAAVSDYGALKPTVGGRTLTVSANGEGNADLTFIHGTALTETDGQLAAAFVKLLDVATPLLVASDVMRGTNSASLASVWTVARAGALTDWINGGRLDLILDIIAADTTTDIPALIAALNDLSAAQVNAEVVDALNVDTYAEPGQGAPPATASLAAKLSYLYKAWRNKTTQTSTTFSVYNDAGAVVDQKATVSDDGTTATDGEVETGP